MEWILGTGRNRINSANAKSLVSVGEQSAATVTDVVNAVERTVAHGPETQRGTCATGVSGTGPGAKRRAREAHGGRVYPCRMPARVPPAQSSGVSANAGSASARAECAASAGYRAGSIRASAG